MASYFVESQAGSSSADTDYGYSSISPGEWEEALQTAEALLAMRGPPQAAAAPAAPLPNPERVERDHPDLQPPLYPEGLAEAPENERKQTSRIVFTINNPGDYRPIFDPEKMAYLVWQLERGAQGTLHIQGYMRLKKRLRFSQLQTLLGGHAAILIARGNEEQCRNYCTKEDTRVEPGEEHGDFNPNAGKQGHRSDLDAIAKLCIAGKTMKEIAVAHPADVARYSTGIQLLHELLAPEPETERPVQVVVFWGPSNVGKTHRVMMNPELRQAGGIYTVVPGRGPFDRYTGQSTIFFDEFDYSKWDIYDMNRLLDKWPLTCDARFHNKSAAWTRVIICANSNPTSWYPYATLEVLEAFRRRLGDGCRHITSREQVPADLPPDPDFSPPPAPAAAPQAAAAAPLYDPNTVLVPDSQPPSPTQIQ